MKKPLLRMIKGFKRSPKRVFIFAFFVELVILLIFFSKPFNHFLDSFPLFLQLVFQGTLLVYLFTNFYLATFVMDPGACYDKRYQTTIFHVFAAPSWFALLYCLLSSIEIENILFGLSYLVAVYINCGITVLGILLIKRKHRSDNHCSHCGASRPEGALFCRACGKPFEKTKLR